MFVGLGKISFRQTFCFFYNMQIGSKIFILMFLLIIMACNYNTSVNNENSSINLLHDISTFTSNGNVNMVVEIPAGSNQKWELNKQTGKIEWEMINPDSARIIKYLPYPVNYGFVPQTLLSKENGGDGDPVDILLISSSIERETIVAVKVIGMLKMTDGGEEDSKLLAIPVEGIMPVNVENIEQLKKFYSGVEDIIICWFSNYKGLSVVEIDSTLDYNETMIYIQKAHKDYINNQNNSIL